jgi:uncharacterized protein (TIGR02099 family)
MFKMDDLPRRPSLSLKTLAIAARWSVWLLLAAWLIFISAWAALHVFIVPRIGELRPQLETRASQALGVTVRIGAISAHSEGLFPSFELSDVRLLDPDGREALRLPRVLAALTPGSLWNLGFEQLYIDGPQLNIRRTVDGRIYVAGLDLSKGQATDDRAGDWFFSQTELVIQGGTLQWTDETRSEPTLVLQQVDLVIRNRYRKHALRLDATPPTELGERFSLRGEFRQPLLSARAGIWRGWEGQIFAMVDRVDLSQLQRYANLGAAVTGGSGALRAWIDVEHGQVTEATADVAMSKVGMTLGPDLAPLALTSLTGRLGGKHLAGGFEFSTQNLQFDTQDGMHWPGGNVRVSYVEPSERSAAWGELQGDRLDLEALAQIARRLPLDARVHEALGRYAPKGLVERIQAGGHGPLDAPDRFEAKGRVSRLEVAARAAQAPLEVAKDAPLQDSPLHMGSPGVRGALVDFDFNQAGGRASLVMQDGQVELPGLFEEPVIGLDQLSADVRWQTSGERLNVQLSNLNFSNADAQGEVQLKWNTSDPRTSPARSRFPGVLDLQGSMNRAEGARVHRYLPLVINRKVRDYLRDAVTGGRASGVRFRVRGDLKDMPFTDPAKGDFRVTASVRNATFTYVPRSLQAAGDLPWPALTQLNGELVLDGSSLQLKDVSAKVAQAPGLGISHGEARIPDLRHAPAVSVSLDARGPLEEMIKEVITGSPLAAMTAQMLSQASAGGNAELRLKLQLPLNELEKSTVQGQVKLAGNELQISPDMPRLTRARGDVHFSEQGFAIAGGVARLLGGEVRAEGGTIQLPGTSATGPAMLRAQGTLTAEGLRQARELGVMARMAQQASGSATYSAVLGFRRRVPELLISSSLQGLALDLPAPLGKRAEAQLPLRLETTLTRESLQAPAGKPVALQDQVSIELGRQVSVRYVRDVSGSEAKVLRGAMGMGLPAGETVPMPTEGVVANVRMNSLDLDAWSAIVAPTAGAATASPPPVRQDGRASGGMSGYLPTSMVIQADELTAGGHKFNRVVAGGSRIGQTWQANVDAREFSGYLEYRQPSEARAGRLYARLARMSLAQAEAHDVESLLEEPPVSIPALDIVVADMELRGKKLGRVEIEAVNRGAARRDAGAREWRLNKFNIITPEAVFTATGNWAVINEPAPTVANKAQGSGSRAERRRTVMNFKLDIADSGELLTRLGMKDVIRHGKGKMEGQVAWVGSPLALDYPTLGGAFNINVENGQFLKAEPGIAKLLGVLSLQSLPRRLTLDFRDVFSDGFAFDFVRGDVQIDQGMAKTNNLQMKGVNAAVLMEGSADIARETQELKVVVVPEINAGTASLIATWINPAVGLGSFLAQLILRRPLIESTTQEFLISGSWADPKITRPVAPAQIKREVSP